MTRLNRKELEAEEQQLAAQTANMEDLVMPDYQGLLDDGGGGPSVETLGTLGNQMMDTS